MYPHSVGYNLSPIRVTGSVYYNMPKWKEYENANNREKARWDTMWKETFIHEQGHYKIAVDGADLLTNRLQNFRVDAYAQTAVRAAGLADAYLKETLRVIQVRFFLDMIERQDLYDTTTEHGENQDNWKEEEREIR